MNTLPSKTYPEWHTAIIDHIKEVNRRIRELEDSIPRVGNYQQAYEVLKEWLELKQFDNVISLTIGSTGVSIDVTALPHNSKKDIEDFYQDVTTILRKHFGGTDTFAPIWGGHWHNVAGGIFVAHTYVYVSWDVPLQGLVDFEIETSRIIRETYDTRYSFVPRGTAKITPLLIKAQDEIPF